MSDLSAAHRPLAEAAGVAAAMVVFALFAHSPMPESLLAAAALLVAGIIGFRSLRAAATPADILGFSKITWKVGAFLAAGGVLGAALAVLFRMRSGAGAAPTGLAAFAVVAAAIGGAEEILYRGYVQGRLRALGPVAAVALAAAGHTAYKSALFVWPPEGVAIDFAFLVAATFLGGLVFGALRELSRSVWPPLAAHVAFDLMVYGDWSQAPWWVWA